MAIGEDERGRRLGLCTACAAAIHAAVFGWNPHRLHAEEAAAASLVMLDAVNVDLEPVVSEHDTRPPGGGAPTPGDALVATARPLVPVAPPIAKAAAPTPVPMTERPRGDRGSSPAPDEPSDDAVDDAQPALAAAQASDERRERGMAMAAAAQAGVGLGARGGPGGRGSGWGAELSMPPAITGKTAFGNGSGGALTGRVCFLPVGTLRISEVRDCPYVATIYTDTLNIPERQFYDGFPGVSRRSEWFLIDYTGTFSVTVNGTYEFRLYSDDGAVLFVDSLMVIDNDGKHAPESRSGRIPLAAGEHRIKVRYAQTTDRMALQLFVLRPGASNEMIFTTQL